MPIYEYRCPGCGKVFEKLVRMGSGAPPCPSCGAAGADRLVSLIARGAGACEVSGVG